MTREKNLIDHLQERFWAVLAGKPALPDPRKGNPAQRKLIDTGYEERPEPLEFIDKICHHGYAEPGYDDPPNGLIVTANWKDDKGKIPQSFVQEDGDPETMLTIGQALDILGCACEWSDEWDTCEGCGRLLRTQANGYSWRRSYYVDDNTGDLFCSECTKTDPEYLIEHLIGNPRTALTFDLPLEDHGFVKLQSGFEIGMHHGQASDPEQIAKALQKRGIKRFLFVLDSVGQFDVSFSVWVDKNEMDAMLAPFVDCWDEPLPPSETNKPGLSPAQEMQRYLQDTSRAMAEVPPGEGPIITKPDPNDPTKAIAYRVSKEDFIAGRALEGH